MLNYIKGLGIGILCLFLFVLGVVFNVEFLNKKPKTSLLSFERNVNVELNASANNFHSQIVFWLNKNLSTKYELSENEKENIENSFRQINQLIREKNICKGGSYNLEPTFSYKDGVKIPNGYKINAILECNVNENTLNSYHDLLQRLDKIAKQSSSFSISIPALKPQFTKEELNLANEKLYDKLIEKSLNLNDYYSLKFNKKCEIKSIISHENNAYMLRSATNSDYYLPNNEKSILQMNANVMFVCN